MEVSHAVASRRSVRAILRTPVDGAVLHAVPDNARRAPSGGNVQPWQAVAVAGGPLAAPVADRIAARRSGACRPSWTITSCSAGWRSATPIRPRR